MTELDKFFQNLQNKSESPTDYVNTILHYYKMASSVDQKRGAEGVRETYEVAQRVHKQFTGQGEDTSSICSDPYCTPGGAVDRERCKRLADGISAISSRTNAVEFPDYTYVDAQISLSSFVREVMNQYFAPLNMCMSEIKKMVQYCKKLWNPVDCANYLVGQMLRREFTYASRPVPLSRLAALTLYYIAGFIEVQSGKYVTIISKDDYDKLNISSTERFDEMGEVVLKLEE